MGSSKISHVERLEQDKGTPVMAQRKGSSLKLTSVSTGIIDNPADGALELTAVHRRSGQGVQFDPRPPEIIPRSAPKSSSTFESTLDMGSLSATSKSNQRSRIFKLIVILALPTIVVFAQCGLMITRAVQRKKLQEYENHSVIYIQKTNDLIGCLQQERRAVTSDYAPLNLSASTNATDKALAEFAMWNWKSDADEPDGKQQEIESHLGWELEARRLSVHDYTTSRSAEILWYTRKISELIAKIPKYIWLTSDDAGLMWKDLVALELFMRIRDDIRLEQDLTISLFAIRTHLAAEEVKWLSENRSEILILFKLSLKFADVNGLGRNLSAMVMDKEEYLLQLDEFARTSENKNNITLDWAMAKTDALLEMIAALTQSCFIRILNTMKVQVTTVYDENALAYGLLAAVAIIFPLLGTVYVRSVNTMGEVIAAYAGDMLVKSAELGFEKRRTDRLLFQMLPPSVANALTNSQAVPAESFESVSIYFSDIVDFEALAAAYEPLEVIDLLNSLYTMFDVEIDHFDVYKVETIGDAYMVASGLPNRNENRHAGELASLALSLMSLATNFELPRMPGRRLLLRIGIHSGPCVTCVIGLKMPRYCLFGDTVNTASRMESTGAALRVHMSTSTKVILDELQGYTCSSRGPIDVKGKGVMYTWWLIGREGTAFQIDLAETEKFSPN